MTDGDGGKTEKPKQRSLETIVTYLEMHAPSHAFVPAPSNLKLTLMRAEKPTAHFYRYLYNAVGDAYHWVDRKNLGDEELLKIIHDDSVSIFVAYSAGVPAGFFEIDDRGNGELWLVYFGVIPDFHGRGIGKWLLAEAIDEAWGREPKVFRVETCTLDDPRALPLYQKMGFTPYERRHKTILLDDD